MKNEKHILHHPDLSACQGTQMGIKVKNEKHILHHPDLSACQGTQMGVKVKNEKHILHHPDLSAHQGAQIGVKMKVIIVGGGQVGSYLASLLLSNGHEIRLIEYREKNYNKLIKELPADVIIYGNGSDPAILEQAGIATADVVAAVSAADEINLVVSTLAKMEFGVPRVVARVNNPKNAWLYNSGMGVDIGVNQADLMAHFVVEEMDLEDMFTIMKLKRGDYSIIQIKVGHTAKAANQLLKDLSIPKKTVLIAITRNEKLIIPKGDSKIMVGDDIMALTDEASRIKLREIFG